MSRSMKIEVDVHGHPWLIVGDVAGGYQAWEIEVVARTRFDRSWQAVRFARDQGDNPHVLTPLPDVVDGVV
jgi:hypothetical protein